MNESEFRPGVESVSATTLTRDELQHFLNVGLEAARAAGEILTSHRGQVTVEYKSDFADLVTVADREAEAAVIERLQRAFPNHGFIGEESGHQTAQLDESTDAGYRWIIDPLDGTTNYAQGLPLFATSIGLAQRDELLVGVIHAPALGVTYTAFRGGGAFVNGEPIHVSDKTDLAQGLLVTGFVHDDDVIRANAPRMQQLIGRTRGVRNLGTAAINLAYVAHGMFEAYWAPANEAWDVAAGVLIVEEAGGKVTDMDGGPLDLFRPRLLATNGHLHQTMLDTLGDP